MPSERAEMVIWVRIVMDLEVMTRKGHTTAAVRLLGTEAERCPVLHAAMRASPTVKVIPLSASGMISGLGMWYQECVWWWS